MTGRVLIAGPDSVRAFLTQVGDALTARVADVETRIASVDPFDGEIWPTIEVLVVFGMPVDATVLARRTSRRAVRSAGARVR